MESRFAFTCYSKWNHGNGRSLYRLRPDHDLFQIVFSSTTHTPGVWFDTHLVCDPRTNLEPGYSFKYTLSSEDTQRIQTQINSAGAWPSGWFRRQGITPWNGRNSTDVCCRTVVVLKWITPVLHNFKQTSTVSSHRSLRSLCVRSGWTIPLCYSCQVYRGMYTRPQHGPTGDPGACRCLHIRSFGCDTDIRGFPTTKLQRCLKMVVYTILLSLPS